MSKRKRHKKHEEHVDESWLIPYADLLTLLLALFIVLFASSSIDAQKFQAIASAFNNELEGGSGVLDFPSPVSDPSMSESEEQENLKAADQKELQEMQEKMTAYIKENNLQDKVETTLNGEGLLLRIRDNVLFNSGESDIQPAQLQSAQDIAKLLIMDIPRSIIISGHTDNVPISTAQFDSNWELSAMRAVNFMKEILKNDQLDPRLFSAKGYGEYQPIASNDTPSGRAQNRRVEILILPQGETEQSTNSATQ
ncbi:flagellar motor protein MotB [Domibacillus enclensis]|uniref:Chemotaxis protein MotB n=1 Tax=Domibacillus enclensis TaxID=1017273 RepID=A0A1N6X1T0_9BACI|nr:flagellar motor protein MotB [Domibacillus enclensis]OXS78091.1 flagellar motor protein MotB [Domibacillus enclensis]SIQ96324.1 chemotaxis protein MotB [Domibacillus enclensis]